MRREPEVGQFGRSVWTQCGRCNNNGPKLSQMQISGHTDCSSGSTWFCHRPSLPLELLALRLELEFEFRFGLDLESEFGRPLWAPAAVN